MKNLVRLVLVWLMLVAIPFQGIASAAMLSCAHDAMQQDATAISADAAAPGSHCHEGDSAIDVQADTAPDHHPASQDHDHDGRCSACAVCCMGAAMAPAPTVAAGPQASGIRFSASATGRLAAVDLALPERPPRFSFA